MTESDIREVLISEFGNEGFSLNFTNKRKFELILHYPKLVIRNSRNEFHNITDLYVKIEKWPYGLEGTSASFQGARASLTKEEYVSHYSHSHLPPNLSAFNSFCLKAISIVDIAFLISSALCSSLAFSCLLSFRYLICSILYWAFSLLAL